MSGIAGFYHLDGRPADRADLGQMIASMAHRGPDGQRVWCIGPIGLGHLQLRTTPESLGENQPFIDHRLNLAITADLRIDNRNELIAKLGLTQNTGSQLSDSQLVLAAYAAWEEDCPNKLLGDFAFVIWDGRRKEFFCARDHFGVKPLYYYSSEKVFAFASEIKALFQLAEVPRRLNELRIADHLAGVFADKESTFYRGILRLPPGRCLRVGRERTKAFSYWSLDPSAEIRLSSDKEYALAFREIFEEAVRCRLRSAFPAGAMLSGGLDSSSITCVARRLLNATSPDQLSTFSTVFDEVTQCDERRYIDSVLAPAGLKPHFIPVTSTGTWPTWIVCTGILISLFMRQGYLSRGVPTLPLASRACGCCSTGMTETAWCRTVTSTWMNWRRLAAGLQSQARSEGWPNILKWERGSYLGATHFITG